mgnify:FL=1
MRFMAPSAASLIAVLAFNATAGAADVRLDENQPIQLDARSSDFDYKSSTLFFKEVRISQGRLWIEADSANANGLNFDSSNWRFTGHVRVGLIDGTLESADAQVTFKHNQVEVADIAGAPAMFEQKRPNGVAHGRANHIEYRPTLGTVRLDRKSVV